MDGVVVVDKPSGMTSHDVVDEVRKRLSTKRVGHGGTLDPDATGVLLLGIGKATRFLSYAQASPKRYEAAVRLGVATSTQDASGDVVAEKPVEVSAEEVRVALGDLRGEIDQIPPMVSAVKIKGKRLYESARAGVEVERPPRRVSVYELEMTWDAIAERAELGLEVLCSGGTYVRTIAHDLGAKLGCGAHLLSLRRTEAAGFDLSDAVGLDEVSPAAVLPLAEVVRIMPRVEVDETEAALVADGRPLSLPLAGGADVPPEGPVAVLRGGQMLAVYRAAGEQMRAERVVPR